MIRPMVRIAGSLVAGLAAMLLAGGGMTMLPSASASAPAAASPNTNASDSSVAIYFNGGGTGIQLCDDPGTFFYNGAVAQLNNPCGTRVWVHYVAGSAVSAYCIDPGDEAYDLPITWKGGDSTNIQVTTNTSRCDAGKLFGLNWCAEDAAQPCPNPLPLDPPPQCPESLCPPDGSRIIHADPTDHPAGVVIGGYYCQPGGGPDYVPAYYVYQVWNVGCDFRIWLHSQDNAGGQSFCISPGVLTQAWNSAAYVQVTETNNQAPCSAGGPPY
jgi:hypothetical protein